MLEYIQADVSLQDFRTSDLSIFEGEAFISMTEPSDLSGLRRVTLDDEMLSLEARGEREDLASTYADFAASWGEGALAEEAIPFALSPGEISGDTASPVTKAGLALGAEQPPPEPDPSEDDGDIVVTGTLFRWWEIYLNSATGALGPTPLPETIELSLETLPDLPPLLELIEDCQKDGEANKIAGAINSAPNDGNERAAITYRDASGNVVSTPISVGAPGTVSVALPPGVAPSQVIGFIHSHPTAPTTGNASVDALYDAADVYPSPSDWDQMDALVAAGANPNTLSFYVVDKNGTAREYDYSDKSIYDVPEEQLLGLPGHPPPPPVPGAVSPSAGQCGK